MTASSNPGYQWTGKDLIAITIKGEKSPMNNWPVLTIGTGYDNGGVLKRLTIDHTSYRTYYITIDSVPNGPVYFLNDASFANNDYQMPPLQISSISFGVLGQSKPVQDDVAKLTAADQNAYVLDPYEYAAALSFALTGSAPSKSLLDAAVAGELVDVTKRGALVDAMIDSDLGKAHVERLAGKWFRTDGLRRRPATTRNSRQPCASP